MYELKKWMVLTSKFVGTGPSSYEKKNLPGRGLIKGEKHRSKTRKQRQVSEMWRAPLDQKAVHPADIDWPARQPGSTWSPPSCKGWAATRPPFCLRHSRNALCNPAIMFAHRFWCKITSQMFLKSLQEFQASADKCDLPNMDLFWALHS